MDNDPRLDQILAALGQLVTVVGSLAETVAQSTAGSPAGGSAPPSEPINISQDDPYLPLAELDSTNVARRTQLAAELGILGTPAGAELQQHGARGFYRRLERDEGQVRIEFPRDVARRLVEDALGEDPREAEHMGRDLLCVWDAEEVETFAERGIVDVLAGSS